VTKYGDRIDDDHWQTDEPEGQPRWREETSADIEIDVTLHDQGYQTDEKWTVHCHDPDYRDGIIAGFAVEHRNKGNYWREGDLWDDAVDFVDLPLPVRQRVAHVLDRPLDAITPEERYIHRDGGRGIADPDGGEQA